MVPVYHAGWGAPVAAHRRITAVTSLDIRQRLDRARLYLCTDLRTQQGDFRDFVAEVFAGGVDLLQVRDKHAAPEEVADAVDTVRDLAPAHALVVVNDSPQVAGRVGADVLHVGQDDMPATAARAHLKDGAVIGLSTHSVAQADAALADAAVDYFCVGPVHATPTKPTYAPVGLDLVRHAAAATAAAADSGARTKPWFAIGGINLATVDAVLDAGARRVVVVRALTEASDPREAARALRARVAAAGQEDAR